MLLHTYTYTSTFDWPAQRITSHSVKAIFSLDNHVLFLPEPSVPSRCPDWPAKFKWMTELHFFLKVIISVQQPKWTYIFFITLDEIANVIKSISREHQQMILPLDQSTKKKNAYNKNTNTLPYGDTRKGCSYTQAPFSSLWRAQKPSIFFYYFLLLQPLRPLLYMTNAIVCCEWGKRNGRTGKYDFVFIISWLF